MIDLRAISSIAPIGDLRFGLGWMLAALVIAQLLLVPRLRRHDPTAASLVLLAGALGVLAALATLVLWPRGIHVVALVYALAFAVTGLAASWRTIGPSQALLRVGGGTACLLVAIAVAWFAAFMPR